MKRNRIILSLIACTLTLTGCDDQIMEWQKADGNINSSEIPLELNEKIALYSSIKTYAGQFTPNMTIGLGLGADLYINDEAYRKVADDNFQMFTTGNAMKHDAIVKSDGTLDFTTMDNFINIVPADIKMYGHNFIWHTQQKQDYLRKLIAPTMHIESDGNIANVLSGDNSNFNGGTLGGWGSWGSNKESQNVENNSGPDGSACMVLKNKDDGQAYSAQCAYEFTDYLETNKTYIIKFKAKSSSNSGELQFQYQNSSSGNQGGYQTFDVGTEWNTFEYEFTVNETHTDVTRIILNFGKVNATYYIDDIEFGLKITENSKQRNAIRSSITYTFKTPEEKKAALETAMEAWIKGMLEHIKNDNRFVAWDVINEPIADGSNEWRGINNVFGGTDGDGNPDTEPVEDPENGLLLNWADNHFYWGYYLGKGYATKAFELARQYAPANMKLYVNDYNLEISPNKLAALIDFVKYIDENNATGQPIVDGIGTQMHVTASSITREQIDAMFQTMAATGKLVRVTELDVALGTASPSAEQLELQANVYQMIFESYKANVPEAQQSGITIWTLSDNAAEHEYWLPDESPNLFDGNYNRKHAYKGVCDGIAGKDISEEFSGDDWKNISSEEESTSEE
ncbi:endo-1,4-beta-xylanase [Bacteroides clarus]|uniref:endo-1,4-beta-xylanase n=2 Tax=Bacteroides clarus TaxID=626929 RepID=UPI00248E6B54|nr:endo-1,4-beta-xylanase [Bacteroides clarus]